MILMNLEFGNIFCDEWSMFCKGRECFIDVVFVMGCF